MRVQYMDHHVIYVIDNTSIDVCTRRIYLRDVYYVMIPSYPCSQFCLGNCFTPDFVQGKVPHPRTVIW